MNQRHDEVNFIYVCEFTDEACPEIELTIHAEIEWDSEPYGCPDRNLEKSVYSFDWLAYDKKGLVYDTFLIDEMDQKFIENEIIKRVEK